MPAGGAGLHQACVCMQCCTSRTVHQENLAVCSWVNETINVPWGGHIPMGFHPVSQAAVLSLQRPSHDCLHHQY